MNLEQAGPRPSGQGSAEYFTGMVRFDSLFESTESGRSLGVSITFEPGARTAWHTHPLGQTTTAMTQIAIVERLDGKTVDWMEHVDDGQYLSAANEV